MTVELGPPAQSRTLYRAASAICPPAERRWLDAMFAELAFVEGRGQRMCWLAGVTAIVASVVRARAAATVPAHVVWSAIFALSATVVFGAGAAMQYEGLGLDDDAYLLFASCSGLVVAGLAALSLNRIFRAPAVPAISHGGPSAGKGSTS